MLKFNLDQSNILLFGNGLSKAVSKVHEVISLRDQSNIVFHKGRVTVYT